MISVQVIIGSDIYKTFMKVKKNHGSFTFGQNEKYDNTKHPFFNQAVNIIQV